MLPPIAWLHWSKCVASAVAVVVISWSRGRVFIDQKALHGDLGGKAYATYSISPAGAVVVVRPDGYVGTVAPLNKMEHLDEYFAGFMDHS